jgi:hypothetical protein
MISVNSIVQKTRVFCHLDVPEFHLWIAEGLAWVPYLFSRPSVYCLDYDFTIPSKVK